MPAKIHLCKLCDASQQIGQVAESAAIIRRESAAKATRPRQSVFSRLEPGGTQPSRRSGNVLDPPIPGARRIPAREHDPRGPPTLLEDGPELAGDLDDYTPFSHPGTTLYPPSPLTCPGPL